MIQEKKVIKYIFDKIVEVAGKPPKHLHEPLLGTQDIKVINECIKSGYISSNGSFIEKFEKKLCQITKAKYCISVSNGTSALHVALIALGIKENHEVLLPSFNFIAAANAILYCRAIPHFIEINDKTLFIDEKKLQKYLNEIVIIKKNQAINKNTNRVIKAAIPLHTFGHTGKIDDLKKILKKFKIKMIEDAAEALGSYYKKKHVGIFGDVGILSFNGNKIISTGGGGAIITNNKKIAKKAKHISKVSKINHIWKFEYDQIGYNYRMPNLNAALGYSQLKKLNKHLKQKRKLRDKYLKVFKKDKNINLFTENKYARSNYWLHILVIDGYSKNFLEKLLNFSNKKKIYLRAAWSLLHKTNYLKKFPKMDLSLSETIHKKIVNLPSSCYKI